MQPAVQPVVQLAMQPAVELAVQPAVEPAVQPAVQPWLHLPVGHECFVLRAAKCASEALLTSNQPLQTGAVLSRTNCAELTQLCCIFRQPLRKLHPYTEKCIPIGFVDRCNFAPTFLVRSDSTISFNMGKSRILWTWRSTIFMCFDIFHFSYISSSLQFLAFRRI